MTQHVPLTADERKLYRNIATGQGGYAKDHLSADESLHVLDDLEAALEEIDRRERFAEEVRIRAAQTGWMSHLTAALHATMNKEGGR